MKRIDASSFGGLGLALALAAAFGAWEVAFATFFADDLLLLGVLEGMSPSAAWTGALDLYTISDGDPAHVLAMKNAGAFPWFFDPVFEMGFLRPLSSGLFALDHALFGLHPVGYRLHGVLWSLLLVAAVGMLLRRALPRRVATLATLLFVLSGIQAMFCWTAARHIVVAAACGFLAVVAHLKWRAGWRAGAVVSLLALAASLAASEVGVAVAAYLFAYEAFGAPDAWRVRLRAAAPAFALLIAYLIVWRALGHGASPGTGYIDPLRDPGLFLRELPPRLAVLAGGVVLGGGADLWVLRPDRRSGLAVVGALAAVAFALLLRAAWRDRSADERRGLRWLGVAAIASALPFAGTPIGSRCLLVPLAGGAALIAAVIDEWWSRWRISPGQRLCAVGAVSLVVVHVLVAPVGRLIFPPLLRGMADRAATAVRDAELDPATFATGRFVVLTAPDLIVGLQGGAYPRLFGLPGPASWQVLSWAPAPHRFTRSAADSLDMYIDGAGIGSASLQPGTTVATRGMVATVLAVGRLGPTHVRFRFDRPLDDANVTLLAWRDGRLRRVPPPPIGEEINLQVQPSF